MPRERRSRSRDRRSSSIRQRLARRREERASKNGSGKLLTIAVVIGFICLAGFLFWKSRAPKGPWNVNEATAAQLDLLPGIGPAMAEDIIDGRPYQRAEDLLGVRGIGEKTLDKIKGELVFPIQ